MDEGPAYEDGGGYEGSGGRAGEADGGGDEMGDRAGMEARAAPGMPQPSPVRGARSRPASAGTKRGTLDTPGHDGDGAGGHYWGPGGGEGGDGSARRGSADRDGPAGGAGRGPRQRPSTAGSTRKSPRSRGGIAGGGAVRGTTPRRRLQSAHSAPGGLRHGSPMAASARKLKRPATAGAFRSDMRLPGAAGLAPLTTNNLSHLRQVYNVFDAPTREGLHRPRSACFGGERRFAPPPKDKGLRKTTATELAAFSSTLGRQMLSHIRSGSFAHFSSSTREEYQRAMGADTNDAVGPGSYDNHPAIGAQVLSNHRSMPRVEFATAVRKDLSVNRSPGPVYKAAEFIGTNSPHGTRAPKYTFGTSRPKKADLTGSPGPIYQSSYFPVGKTAPSHSFGTAKRFNKFRS